MSEKGACVTCNKTSLREMHFTENELDPEEMSSSSNWLLDSTDTTINSSKGETLHCLQLQNAQFFPKGRESVIMQATGVLEVKVEELSESVVMC